MLEKIKQMFEMFLTKLGYTKKTKVDVNVQQWQDIQNINWGAMAGSKIANLACGDVALEVTNLYDSTLIQPLQKLCEQLEEQNIDIAKTFLGTGDCYIFPSISSTGELYHSILDDSRVSIIKSEDEKIKKAYAVIDAKTNKAKTKTKYLLRMHELDNNGTLTISYEVIDDNGNTTSEEEWEYLTTSPKAYINANHIGFGRYKSPVSSRGLENIYGVPINFGCAEIEKQLNKTLSQIEKEYTNAESKVFTDARLLEVDDNGQPKKYKIAQNIFPIRTKVGESNLIDIYSPEIRGSQYFEKLHHLLELFEKQMGLSAGIFTENQTMATGTATAVNRSNADTLAFLSSVWIELNKGNKMTLEADALFLGIRKELWEYQGHFKNPFEDTTEFFNKLITAEEKTIVTKERVLKALFPQMTDEQIEEELTKAKENKSETAVNSILQTLRS